MSNFSQTQTTYEFIPNTGFRSFNEEFNKVNGKYRQIMKNPPPPPPAEPLFNTNKGPLFRNFFDGRASGGINREMLYKINQDNWIIYNSMYY